MQNKEFHILNGTYNYIVEYGLERFSLNELLKYLNISKGTFYHYFNSKDEMLLEIFNYMITSFINGNKKKLNKASNLKEKLEVLYEVYLIESKTNNDFLVFYNEFILNKTYSESLKEYSQKMQLYFKDTVFEILNEEISKNKIDPRSIDFTTSIISIADGMLIYSFSLEDFSLRDELTNFIDSFTRLVEIKKEEKYEN